MRYLPALLVLSALVRPLPAAHKPILPRPQQIQYGSGRLPLRGVSVDLGSTAGPEDRFAANELSSALSLMAGRTLPVVPRPVVAAHPPALAIAPVRPAPVDVMPRPRDRARRASPAAHGRRTGSRRPD